ncbi:MAG TPA: type IV pilus assembly protein PilM [Mycobacteriales bacterium]|nr:type IV pilus assembly protein PilM [Mycobacteriales bacterium]
MASKVVGLDIGTSGVRAAELSLGRGAATLERFGQVALPAGAVHDGEVVDAAAVGAALRQLWAQAKFSSKKVVLGVANQKVVVRQVDVPWLPEDELRKSLAFQVADFLPMAADEAILDFHALEEFTNDNGGRMLRILLVAAARDMVGNALAAVKAAGLDVQMVDLTSFAVLRSTVGEGAVASPSSEALVDIGASVTNIVVHQGGVPRFVRILMLGGADITSAVAERLGVPQDQAEAVKQQTGLAQAPSTEAHPAQRAIEASGSAFVDEVRGSLDYFMAQPGAGRIDRIVISGGGSLLAGLAERLQAATRLPVHTARPMSQLKIGKTGLTPEQLAYVEPMVTVPVGLAMGVS